MGPGLLDVVSLWRSTVVAVLAALPLTACGTDTSLLNGGLLNGGQSTTEQTGMASPISKARPVTRFVAFRPPVGPPDSVNAELSRQLNDSAIDTGIALVSDQSFKHDILLRGYVTALRKGSAVNLSYLWDVVDARGQRINRFEGEEALSGVVDVKDPWAAVTPAVSRAIAQRTISDLSRWLQSRPQLAAPVQAAPSMPSAVGAPPAAALVPPAQ